VIKQVPAIVSPEK